MDFSTGFTAKAATIDGQLLALANIAANVTVSGPYHEFSRWYEAAGVLETPIAIVSGVSACLVAKIQDNLGQPLTCVVYRGTLGLDDETRPFADRLLDWIGDIHMSPVAWHGTPWTVHAGFAESVDSLQAQIDVLIPDDRRVLFCGHSKGGALAVLSATQRYLRTGKPGTVVTFGAPRCGGSAFANAFEQLPIIARRFENSGDLVPYVPVNEKFAELIATAVGHPFDGLDYKSVGALRYVDRDGQVQPATFGIGDAIHEVACELAIAEHLFHRDLKAIRDAHAIGFKPSGQFGYASAIAPEVQP